MHKLPIDVHRFVLDLHVHGIQPIRTVGEFDDFANCVPNGAIVLNDQILQTFDQPSLQVTGFGRFDSRIDQTLTTGHGMEEKLGRRETRVEAILDEASGRWDFC